MKMKSKAILPFLALVLCIGVFLFPMTAFAQTNDTTPPTLTAELSGDTLTVQANDDIGVEAIYVDGHRFSTLVNGAASIKLSDYSGDGQQVTIYATDTSGNRSQSMLLNNPYYVQPTAAPTASAAQAAGGTAEASPAPSPVTESALPEPVMPDSATDSVENGGDGTAGITESAITGTTAFTPEGEGTVVDNATDEDGREFFTVTATDGSVYYLIIDRQRGTENVYFLNAVTKDDLTSLAEDGAETESGIAAPAPQPEESEAQPEDEQEQVEQPAQSEGNTGTIIFILLIVAIAGGVGYYVKIVKPRRQARQEDEGEYEDELEDYDGGEDEYFFARPEAEEAVDKDVDASYNDSTEEETRDS